MNTGAFGENFPYSNFHDLNTDWIIKIAKDFLDQYTHIQETIDNGLEALDNKAEALEELLQAWYDTHSKDIANQLADALEDLNNWYTEHQGYLNQYLTDSIATFNQAAEQKAQQTIATIPEDYTALTNNVNNLRTALNNEKINVTGDAVDVYDEYIDGEYVDENDGTFKTDAKYKRTPYIKCYPNNNIRFGNTDTQGYYGSIYNAWYDENKNFISSFLIPRGGETIISVPKNASYFVLSFNKTVNEYYYYKLDKTFVEMSRKMAVLDNKLETENSLIDFDNIQWVDGVYINENKGTEIEYPTWKASGYIELNPNNEYAMLYEHDDGMMGTFNGLVYYAWYDAERAYVTGGKTESVLTYHSPRAKFLRVSMGKAQSKTLVLNTSDIISNLIGVNAEDIVPPNYIKIKDDIDIKRISEQVSNLETNPENYTLQSSWANKLEELRLAKGKKFTFGIQTDTHYTIVNDSIDFGNDLKRITTSVGVDFIANLGDIIRGYDTENIDDPDHTRQSYTEIMKRYVNDVKCPFLFAVGNHDKNTMWADKMNDPSLIFSLDEIYARTIALAKNTMMNVTFDGRSLYYYIDFEDAGIRVVVLNTTDAPGNNNFNISQTQCNWFENKALDTTNSIIVLGHAPLEGTWDYMVFNTVTNGDVIMSALRSFKARGGEVIGCFWGHDHAQVSETVNGILHVSFKDRDTAEFVMIDKNNRTIDTIGFGGATNRHLTWTA